MVLYFIVWKPSSSLQVVTYAGGGTNATINGSLMNAQFGDIEGIVFHNDFMYISEKSSTIRVISKSLGIVNTLISDTVGQYDSLGFVNGSGMVWMNESLFVCDAGNHAVRRIINGNVTTVVGGRVGYVDGPLSDALLDTPVGIAVDDRMNLYVTEQHRIRMISNDGIVSTIAGSIPGFQDGTGTEAMFSYPTGIVWSNGVLYVADRYNSRIRKVVGNQVTTLAGGLNGPFSQPMYLAIDGDLLYVTDSLLHQIKTVKINDGQVQVVAGNGERGKRNGKLQESQFNLPLGIAVDRDSVYVVDRDNFVIRRISK
jgi:hypothetical protein